MKKHDILTARVEKNLVKPFEAIAKEQGLTKSSLLNQLVKELVESRLAKS
ncbi:MAG: hypothetical protein SFY66_10790 [Oculatellaceae cyanobacterium bins.114]|nr:hypothetical protein [Oculatellaceae cyanobacterium bins.114]